MADAKLSLKLLVDRQKNRVVLAEAGRDFVDILLSFLTLPVSTIVRVLNKRSLLGCMDRLYESVEKLDLRFMATKACKTMLLRPRSAAEKACEDLKLNADDTTPRRMFRCPTWDCCTKNSLVYSPVEDAKCPACGLNMDKLFVWTKLSTREDGVFVKSEGSFTISDDLHVIPTSTDATLSVLHRFGISDCTVLDTLIIQIGLEEVLYLLRRSLLSKMVLTDVFLHKPEESPDVDILGEYRIQSPVKCEAAASICTKRLKMKLILSKSKDTLLYAEADGDVVDLLFSFLTFPVGSIIKLLDKCSSLGSLDNLYESVQELIETDRWVHSAECTDMLLSPKLASHYACTSQLLSIHETACRACRILGCEDCYKLGGHPSRAGAERCCNEHGIKHVTLSAANPKLPVETVSTGRESGGGFVKGREVFMIADDLAVEPVSLLSSIPAACGSGIAFSDMVVREVSLGEPEALKLLKASLITKQVLTNVFCYRTPKISPA